MGKQYFISSGKGGVGKSVFAANIGAVFAERGIRVAWVDMNIGLRNLDIYLGLQDEVVFDAADVLNGVVPLDRALVRDRRFQMACLLSTAQDRSKFRADEHMMKALYEELSAKFDIVLVDGPAGVNEETRLAATAADVAVIVATPEYVSIRDADMMDQTLRARGIGRRVYIVNKVNRAHMGLGALPTVERIASVMKLPLIGVIQTDDAIHLSANQGIPIVMQRGNYIERNFSRIADRLLDF